MNYLNNKTVYLCGAMLSLNDCGVQWRELITPKLESYGLTVLDPTRKTTDGISEIGDDKNKFREICKKESWQELTEVFAPVARWDLRSVDKADFIIVNYDASVPSVGTWHEIVVANIQRKPILVYYRKDQLNLFNPWLSVVIKPNHFFSDWDDIFAHLDVVNSGNFNKKLWTL